jgi:hypothetical protein
LYIRDGQNGAYYPHNPDSDILSFGFSQLCSHNTTATELMNDWAKTTDKQNYMNQRLGLAYIDKQNRPIDLDVISRATDKDAAWYHELDAEDKNRLLNSGSVVLGCDHMSNSMYVVIGVIKRGIIRLIHAEVIEMTNKEYYEQDEDTGEMSMVSPFHRLEQMMFDFKVSMAILDHMPNPTSTREFGMKFKGRVFLSDYDNNSRNSELAQWFDKPRHKITVRKSSKTVKYKYKVRLQRYLAIDHLFTKISNGNVRFPDMTKIMQTMAHPDTGIFCEVSLGDLIIRHLMGVVRRKEIVNETSGEYRLVWARLSDKLDPHFLHAMTYMVFAADRAHRKMSFIVA